MYKSKKTDNAQASFTDFNQMLGLQLDPNNRWIRLADMIPWDQFETRYANLFSDKNIGNVAKPFRTALGSLILQAKLGCSDRELVQQITENPYLQYFIGLPGYQTKPPYDPSMLTLFRKRISMELVNELNEDTIKDNDQYLLNQGKKRHKSKKKPSGNDDDHSGSSSRSSSGGPTVNSKQPNDDPSAADNDHADGGNTPAQTSATSENRGTLILDATCAPMHIRFPMDASLLNEAREQLEMMIRGICSEHDLKTPRMYRKVAHKEYLNLAKSKRPGADKIRKVIGGQLSYVKRDLGYIEDLLAQGFSLGKHDMVNLLTIQELYQQQKQMYDNHEHRVDDRIVSIQMPFIRPIVRGKTNKPVEFGPKFDMSLDEYGMAHIEKFSYDAYNEAGTLIDAVENYRKRTGHYPERVLVDQIYRNRENRSYCKEHGIRMSGPRLGRKTADPDLALQERRIEYQDNTDRIEVERSFSRSKRSFNLDVIVTKLEDTVKTSVAMSIFVSNLFKILGAAQALFLALLLYAHHAVLRRCWCLVPANDYA